MKNNGVAEERSISVREYARTGFAFFRALTSNIASGTEVNRRLSDALKDELERRVKTAKQEVSDADWNMYEKKLLRFRPRLLGGAAAYATVAGISHRDVLKNGGFSLFRMLWFLGSSQDDLIDELPRNDFSLHEKQKQIRAAIFGKDKTFYQAAFTVFARELMSSDMSPEAKRYIKTKVSEWYRFLVQQEAQVLSYTDLSQLTFSYCTEYRESQNREIGEALTACLNGRECLDVEYRKLEVIVPILSFRTQVIDDIADIAEDLRMERPSYCIGALVDHPEELRVVSEYLSKNTAQKFTPILFEKLAPESYRAVRAKFDEYGEELETLGASGAFLSSIGNLLYAVFPKWRDTLYKIHPESANF